MGGAAGSGSNLFPAAAVEGNALWFRKTGDVLSAAPDDLPGTVAFVHHAGMTFLSPIIEDLAGIVCTEGTPSSDLAQLAREFGVPCVMGASLEVDIPDGARVRVSFEDPQTAHISVVDP